MHAFLAGDADVLVSTTIIESGHRHPAGEHPRSWSARTRSGSPSCTRSGAASAARTSSRTRTSSIRTRRELTPGGAGAARDPRRPHRARRRLPDRDARPRDPWRGRPPRPEQSGHVAALGFELYVEMLNEAVAELSGERRIAARPVRVDARVDAYVPASYVAAEALKIDLHRRIALVEDEDELRELVAVTEDRYGPLPEPVAEPVRDPGGEAEARPARGGLPRLPRRTRHRRARSRSARSSCRLSGPSAPTASTRPRSGGVAPGRDARGGAGAARCYSRGPFGRLSRGLFLVGRTDLRQLSTSATLA